MTFEPLPSQVRKAAPHVTYRAGPELAAYLEDRAQQNECSVGAMARRLAVLAACRFHVGHMRALSDLADLGHGPHAFDAACMHARHQLDEFVGFGVARYRELGGDPSMLPKIRSDDGQEVPVLPFNVELGMIERITECTRQMRTTAG